eukprot:6468289-Amphidinium_carterae.1
MHKEFIEVPHAERDALRSYVVTGTADLGVGHEFFHGRSTLAAAEEEIANEEETLSKGTLEWRKFRFSDTQTKGRHQKESSLMVTQEGRKVYESLRTVTPLSTCHGLSLQGDVESCVVLLPSGVKTEVKKLQGIFESAELAHGSLCKARPPQTHEESLVRTNYQTSLEFRLRVAAAVLQRKVTWGAVNSWKEEGGEDAAADMAAEILHDSIQSAEPVHAAAAASKDQKGDEQQVVQSALPKAAAITTPQKQPAILAAMQKARAATLAEAQAGSQDNSSLPLMNGCEGADSAEVTNAGSANDAGQPRALHPPQPQSKPQPVAEMPSPR